MRRRWENLKLQARKFLQCYAQSAAGHAGGSRKTRLLREMQSTETWLLVFQRRRGVCGEPNERQFTIHSGKTPPAFYPRPEILGEAGFKSNRLVCLAEERSSQGGVRTVMLWMHLYMGQQ